MISSPQSSSQLVSSYQEMIPHSHSYSVQEPSLNELSVFFYIIAVYQEITAVLPSQYIPDLNVFHLHHYHSGSSQTSQFTCSYKFLGGPHDSILLT